MSTTAGPRVGESTAKLDASSSDPAASVDPSGSASALVSDTASAIASTSASAPRNPNACAPPDEGWGKYESFVQMGKERLALPKVDAAPEGGFDVVVHFHMGDAIRRTVVQHAYPAIYLSLDVGEGSNKYKKEFTDTHAFRDLRASLDKVIHARWGASAKVARLFLSSWSAGFGATTAILKREPDALDGIILLDSLYGSYAASPEGEPIEGELLTPPLEPMVRFARRAIAGEKLFFLSHSAIVPKGYASTGEVAAFLLKALDVRARDVAVEQSAPDDEDAKHLLVKRADKGNFHVRSYLGMDPKAHCNHLKYVREALELGHVGR